MFKLGEQVIYHDTDSIIYSVKPGQYNPELVDNLGELSNEISLSEGGHIIETVAPGPKNYIYKKKNGKCKSVNFMFNFLLLFFYGLFFLLNLFYFLFFIFLFFYFSFLFFLFFFFFLFCKFLYFLRFGICF